MSRSTPGEQISKRLSARADRLHRQAMPGGGEVFSGPLASRALKALGARAMTVDRSIVVGEDFQASKAESQALYAHEQVHVQGSGGAAGLALRDAEEVAARAAERMVLHRALSGGYEAGPSLPADLVEVDKQKRSGSGDPASNLDECYAALLAQGVTHDDIVELISEACVKLLDDDEQSRADRGGHLSGSF